MTKLEYAQAVCKYIEQYGYKTTIIENSKNNQSAVSIVVRSSDDEALAPTFNIYGTEEEDPATFADNILSFEPAEIDTDELTQIMTDREKVLDRVYYILVNSEMNKDRTDLVRRYINKTLELQFKVDIKDIVEGASITLEYKHIQKLGISPEELYERAYVNTMEKFPYKFASIWDFIPIDGVETDAPPMWVLTNNVITFGAGAILYKGMREVLEEKVGDDFLVIPSSIHEVIIIPTWLGEKDDITATIREINSNMVRQDEVLSDRLYELVSDGMLFEV